MFCAPCPAILGRITFFCGRPTGCVDASTWKQQVLASTHPLPATNQDAVEACSGRPLSRTQCAVACCCDLREKSLSATALFWCASWQSGDDIDRDSAHPDFAFNPGIDRDFSGEGVAVAFSRGLC